jgi:type IV secretion system protein VirB10
MMSTDSLSPSSAVPSSDELGDGFGGDGVPGAGGKATTVAGIAGERGPAWVKRGASMQARVQNGLALAVVAVLGGAFLFWYYARVAAEPPPVAEQARAQAATQGEMALPPLGPAPVKVATTANNSALIDPDSEQGRTLLAGELTCDAEADGPALADGPPAVMPTAGATPGGHPPAPPVDPVQQRRLEAPVLIRGTGSYAAVSAVDAEVGVDVAVDGAGPAAGLPQALSSVSGTGPGSGSALAGMLQPTRSAAVAAGVMPERRFLLPKGAFIDCTLETAIDSSLPGLATCITATDVWSADGAVVLMERGTKLTGESRGEVRHGQSRLFVLWSEARTPSGVIVELASPGTDELGRAGVTGAVDTHFAARFGAAILISLIDAGTAALVASQGDGSGSVVIAPQGASDVVAEVLRQTADVRPTIRVAQGGRLQVLVARDVSFADVYALVRR